MTRKQQTATTDIFPHGKRTTAAEYMQELINYGGQFVPRGYVYQLLIQLTTAQGHDNPRVLADRWMQGHDLRQQAIKT